MEGLRAGLQAQRCYRAYRQPTLHEPSSGQQQGDVPACLHPTQKPLALFEYLITNEHDLVLDNCAGSGTTAIACLKLNRRYICIEKEPNYHAVAHNHIEAQLDNLDPFRAFR